MVLPPYSPELNPAEKIWWSWKRAFSNHVFKDLDAVSEFITEQVFKLKPEAIIQTCKYDYVFFKKCMGYYININNINAIEYWLYPKKDLSAFSNSSLIIHTIRIAPLKFLLLFFNAYFLFLNLCWLNEIGYGFRFFQP